MDIESSPLPADGEAMDSPAALGDLHKSFSIMVIFSFVMLIFALCGSVFGIMPAGGRLSDHPA